MLVTHAVDFLHLADQVLYMKDRKVVKRGPFKELVHYKEV